MNVWPKCSVLVRGGQSLSADQRRSIINALQQFFANYEYSSINQADAADYPVDLFDAGILLTLQKMHGAAPFGSGTLHISVIAQGSRIEIKAGVEMPETMYFQARKVHRYSFAQVSLLVSRVEDVIAEALGECCGQRTRLGDFSNS
ncbi:MAG TPA: hypothetical protein VLA77_03710 [Candidatus Saccharimonadales bacterium]|nr:hypothetical protein [Candidatus Saccharimonadales bacterium]